MKKKALIELIIGVKIEGLQMFSTVCAALHPAARYWGQKHVSANQKSVESVYADLGYAVKTLIPTSTLENSW
ncbi:hypothetical protein EPUL_003930, partial [Erysiphe pulchra]